VVASCDPCEDHVRVEIPEGAGLLAVEEAVPAGTEVEDPLASAMAGRVWDLAHYCKESQRTDSHRLS